MAKFIQAFIAKPRTVGRIFNQRFLPALPSCRCWKWGLLADPIVAQASLLTFLTSPLCKRILTYLPAPFPLSSSFDTTTAFVPALRQKTAPFPAVEPTL